MLALRREANTVKHEDFMEGIAVVALQRLLVQRHNEMVEAVAERSLLNHGINSKTSPLGVRSGVIEEAISSRHLQSTHVIRTPNLTTTLAYQLPTADSTCCKKNKPAFR